MTDNLSSLKDWLSRLVHQLLNVIGLEIRLVRNLRTAAEKFKRDRTLEAWRVIGHHPFSCILDIGANEGQFAELARQIWPQAQIHSFEPLPGVYAALVEQFRDDPQVMAHNIGLSDQSGMQCMHHSAFSPSSSLLPMAQLHRTEWPQSVAHTDVDVQLQRLDDWSRSVNLNVQAPMLIKIDVQGFEMAVINGGIETLRSAAIVALEVSFYELYEGQPLFDQIYNRLRGLGFIYRGNIEQYRSRERSRILYADAIFENTANKSMRD